MAVRGVLTITFALFLGIAALVLHLRAIWSPDWKITKRSVELDPPLGAVTYGLWKRCEYVNMTLLKQGVSLGVRSDIKICRPNRYMRYTPDKYYTCNQMRRTCPVIDDKQLSEGCSCSYLPSTKGLQWLTCLGAICIILGLLLLYLKVIATPQNSIAVFIHGYGPFICFFLTLNLLITGLILHYAYFRRDTYEDYSFPLQSISNDTKHLQGFDLHSLRNYVKYHESKFDHEHYVRAEKEFRTTVDGHFHTTVGPGTWYEITATLIIFAVTGLTFLIGWTSKSDGI